MSIAAAIVAVAVLLAFVGLAVATTYRYARRDILHPVVLVNGILAYYVLIPATYLLVTGMAAFPNRFDIARPMVALAVALFVLLGMYLLVLVAFRRMPRTDSTRVGDALADANPGLLLVLGLVGFAVGVISYAAYVWLNGGLVRLLTVTPRTAFYHVPNTLRFRIIGFLGVFGGWATVLCALRPALERNTPLSTTVPRRAIGILAVTTAITLAVAISTRARMVVLAPVCILILYLWTADWFSRRLLVGVGALAVAAVVSFSAIEGLLVIGFRTEIPVSSLVGSVIHIPRFALVMVVVESVPGQVGFQWGATLPHAFYLDLGTFPRYGNLLERIAMGVDKPDHTSSAMLPGELWVNFGPVGLAVGGLVYGAALRWVYRLRTSASALVRGVQPIVFVCVLLLWPTNLTWGVPKLFVRFLVPVAVALAVAVVVQRRLPSLARTLDTRIGGG